MHFFLPSIFILFFLDAATKVAAKTFLLNGPFWIWEPYISFSLAFNTGIALSLPVPLWLQISISIILFIVFIWWARKYFFSLHTIEQLGITIFISGALGNFWERVIFGKVTDFISISGFGYQFPIFNIADICIFIGIILWFWGAQKVK